MPPGLRGMRSFTRDGDVTTKSVPKGTTRRILSFASGYSYQLTLYLSIVVLDAAVGVVNPLIFRKIINDGVLKSDPSLVVRLALIAGAIAIADAVFTFLQRGIAAQIGQSMLYDMRVRVFNHVQEMSLAFFMRTRTGSLVSRLNSDVVAVRDAFTDILSSVVSNAVTVTLVLTAMLVLSWQITLFALIIIPIFILPARYAGKRLQKLTRENHDLNAAMSDMMVERFSVAGAQLAKVFGRPEEESALFSQRAGRVRDIGVTISVFTRFFFIALGLTASLAVVFTYGWGGTLAAKQLLDVGTLVALTAYLARLYGPLTSLSNVQVDVMTTLVSFDRVFEILDLKPMVAQKQNAVAIPDGPLNIEFKDVQFRYPSANEVSLASLESVAVLSRAREGSVLHGVSFKAPAGKLTALVGPSGAGKTTITQLVPRLYDVTSGKVLINDLDVRDVRSDSIREKIGIVSQEAHMFHDSVRANLAFAKPGATDAELWSALDAAQIRSVIESLPQKLDTVIGERGHRLSGGEKQRLAIARVLLKAPAIVILDEATAHLDSESERAIQEAFRVALSGRTSLVIAHRLSTIQRADQILVVSEGRIVERGTHDELLAKGGLYADLYRTQFAQ